jgi:hypothetical protein
MQAQTLYTGTPADIEAAMMRVVTPLIEQIQQLQKAQQLPQEPFQKAIYTVSELAEHISYSAQMVRRFIREGRRDRKGKLVYLKAKEITTGDFRITSADLNQFLSHF